MADDKNDLNEKLRDRDELDLNVTGGGDLSGCILSDTSDQNKFHKYSPSNLGPVPAHI